MKTYSSIFQSILFFTLLFSGASGISQLYYSGGYQGGNYGEGGEDVFAFYPEPRNLMATGGNNEVFLNWDEPVPMGELRHDDGTAEFWYYLSSPSSTNDMFYTKFTAPVSGDLTDVAILNGAAGNTMWENILVCPDNGSGEPDLNNPWQTFPAVSVINSPVVGGEWDILTFSVPQALSYLESFYVVTQWPNGSTVGPFLATDGDSDSGNNAWTIDGGTTWNPWPQNFIIRAYMQDNSAKSASLVQITSKKKNGYLPVVSISDNKLLKMKCKSIALSLEVPDLLPGNYKSVDVLEYNIYRSVDKSSPKIYLASTTGKLFTDGTAANDTEYFYAVTASYSGGESDSSNTASALPQSAEQVPYSNNFDTDNGGFYGTNDWEWGMPVYTEGPSSAYSAPNVWGTNLASDYSIMSNSWLTLPFDMSAVGIYTLDFYYWMKSEENQDYGFIAIDHDYDNIFTILDSITGNSSGWTNKKVKIPDSLLPDSQSNDYIKLAFIFQSDQETTDPGWYIDDMILEHRIDIDLKVFLEGPYSGPDMSTTLNAAGLIPLTQPYSGSPWNYSGTESVPVIPNTQITDWVLLELREESIITTTTTMTVIDQGAAFLLNDGTVVGLDGASLPSFEVEIEQDLYLVVYHRNHLSVMTSGPLSESAGVYSFDLSSGSGQAFNNGEKEIASGVWGMYGGDTDASDNVDAWDYSIWRSNSGNGGYDSTDVNLDGESENQDKNEIILENTGIDSQVPQ